MKAEGRALALSESIDLVEGSLKMLDRIREDIMCGEKADANELGVVQEALKSASARLLEIHAEE